MTGFVTAMTTLLISGEEAVILGDGQLIAMTSLVIAMTTLLIEGDGAVIAITYGVFEHAPPQANRGGGARSPGVGGAERVHRDTKVRVRGS